jgi:hypothetical protein
VSGPKAPGRGYEVVLTQFGTWKVKRQGGTTIAAVKKERWIDDGCDPLDVVVILLLRSVGVTYDNLVTGAQIAMGPTSTGVQ